MTSSLRRQLILDPNKTYTFRSYFEMRFPIDEILQELGFLFTHEELALSQKASAYQKEVTLQAQSTKQRIIVAQKHVDLSSEASRREMLIAPIILDLVHLVDVRVNIEYKIEVNQFLRGDVDYYLKSKHHVLIVEAKQADLGRGFVQLATELIALDAWIDSKDQIIYGAVTTGDIWQFGLLNREQKCIAQDLMLYRVSTDLEDVMAILVWMLRREENE